MFSKYRGNITLHKKWIFEIFTPRKIDKVRLSYISQWTFLNLFITFKANSFPLLKSLVMPVGKHIELQINKSTIMFFSFHLFGILLTYFIQLHSFQIGHIYAVCHFAPQK